MTKPCVCNRLPQTHEFSQSLCGVIIPPMMTIPVAQWAAVTGLVEEWESNVPEGHDAGVLGGMFEGCARQLRKALGLERATRKSSAC